MVLKQVFNVYMDGETVRDGEVRPAIKTIHVLAPAGTTPAAIEDRVRTSMPQGFSKLTFVSVKPLFVVDLEIGL